MRYNWKTYGAYFLIIGILLLCTCLGSHAVTVFSENEKVERKTCVIIDPGHGGEDGGAVSWSGQPESMYNLEISFRLKDLMNLLGYNAKLTRSSDISIYTKGETLAQKKASDLKERVMIINSTEGGVLLSIHQNYYSDDRYSGAQVFYAKTPGSDQLAKELQSAFVAALNPGSRRQAKKSSGIYLMDHIQCPGILIECGFLSNPQEDKNLKDPEYQKKLCSVISTVAAQYLSNT